MVLDSRLEDKSTVLNGSKHDSAPWGWLTETDFINNVYSLYACLVLLDTFHEVQKRCVFLGFIRI